MALRSVVLGPSTVLPSRVGCLACRPLKRGESLSVRLPSPKSVINLSEPFETFLQFLARRFTWLSSSFFVLPNAYNEQCCCLVPETFAEIQLVDSTSSSSAPSFRAAASRELSLEMVLELNDAVGFILPCAEAGIEELVRNTAFWDHFKSAMSDYEEASINGANVSLVLNCRPNGMQRLKLRILRDISEGNELLLHYGHDFWSHVIAAALFSNIRDLQKLRWIEALLNAHCIEGTSVPFPDIRLKELRRSKKSILWNSVTRQRATDEAAVAFAIRESIIHRSFLADIQAAATTTEGIEKDLPIKTLRRLLLRHLSAA